MTLSRSLSAAAILTALVGLAASIYAYLSPSTGVNDTAGPLLTALGHGGMVALGALLLAGVLRLPLTVFFGLAALATAFAGYLLLQPTIYIAALVAFVLVILGQTIGADR